MKRVSKDTVAVYFDLVKEGGVSWEAGIRDGDRLLAINGVEIRNTLTAQYLLNQVAGGDSAYYLYQSNGHEYESYVEIKKLVNFGALAISLAAMLWLIVGFIVIKSKPEGELQQLFFKIGIYLVLFSFFGMLLNNFNSNPLYDYTWLVAVISIILVYAACFLPFFIIRFFWLFPKQLQILKYSLTEKLLTYTPRVLFGVTIILFLLQQTSLFNSLFFTYQSILSIGLFILFMSAVCVGYISLIISYFKLSDKQEKKPIFLILISYTIAIAAIIYTSTLADQLAQTIFNEPEYFFPVLLIAVLPLSFAYSIFKYSLMDVGDVIKNTMFYGLLTVALAASYFLTIYILGLGISSAVSTEYQGILAGFIFVLFAVLFQSTKDKFQDYITQKFYPEQFASQKILMQFSNDVPTVVGLENILNSTQSIFIDNLRIKKFAVYLRESNSDRLSLVRSFGINILPENFNHDTDAVLNIIETKTKNKLQPAIEQEEFNRVFPDISKQIIGDEIYTVIPLMIKSRLIGLLLFGLKYSGARFAGRDLELLNAAANQISISLENARLYESEAEKMKMERELENARKIQESLLPKSIPEFKNLDISGCMIPAMQVGGDYYDVIKVSKDKVFVIVGDVSGKGLSASFYMSKLQTMMRLYCTEKTSPKEVLSNINRLIYESIERNWFITVAVGLFDLEKNILNYCRAGHTPLLITNNSNVELHQPKGLGVGLESGEIFDSALEELVLELKPDNTYIFYSDGINEAMNEADEMFGMERFQLLVSENSQFSSREIVKNTVANLKQFRSLTKQNDDITLVVAKYL